MAVVVITQDDAIEQAIHAALQPIALEPLVRNKLVAVKPNDTWASAQDKTGVTQPDTLRAVLRHVKQYRPRELVVTGGAGAAETEDVFRIAGLMDVVEEEGATFFDHNRPPFTSVELGYVRRISPETVRQFLKKTRSSRGSTAHLETAGGAFMKAHRQFHGIFRT